ncbi:hypothetical protein NMY22_g18082 [Coprinellus aureogranulatus]|nr:hypothetical protein NMY22_g18082 [Coprinellus aureogranulatus]
MNVNRTPNTGSPHVDGDLPSTQDVKTPRNNVYLRLKSPVHRDLGLNDVKLQEATYDAVVLCSDAPGRLRESDEVWKVESDVEGTYRAFATLHCLSSHLDVSRYKASFQRTTTNLTDRRRAEGRERQRERVQVLRNAVALVSLSTSQPVQDLQPHVSAHHDDLSDTKAYRRRGATTKARTEPPRLFTALLGISGLHNYGYKAFKASSRRTTTTSVKQSEGAEKGGK